ncbi:MAG: DUF4876 domain-containing protein [Gemmatimonadaceae bacterium]
MVTPLTAAPVPDTALSDSLGIAHFRNLAAGGYSVAASRTLSDSEIARAGDALGGSTAFTSVISSTIGDDDEEVAIVRLAPVDRGALLFSEFSPLAQKTPAGNVWYYHGNYFRVYNNADTAVALASKLFVHAFPSWHDFSSTNPNNSCATFASLMRDPVGVWAQFIYRFPNDAKVLRPGESVLIVTDAIDHRPIGQGAPGFHDFSRADFEFIGGSDVDNPTLPNIVSVGPRNSDPLGHGWHAHDNRAIYALAQPLDLDTLPKQYNAVWAAGSNFVRIPKAALLDVLSTAYEVSPSQYPECLPSVLPTIDAAEARLLVDGRAASLHRRTARTLPTGRIVLQRSRNSAADWLLGPMTPFVVP